MNPVLDPTRPEIVIDPPVPDDDQLPPEIAADVRKFEEFLGRYLAGEIEEDVFRTFRLANGVYGQRQGGTNQMIRVKLPYGSIQPEQLEMLAFCVERFSRGWGHITTRQNIQFHFVPLHELPTVMRYLGSVGLTTREACGDTVRNIMGCHLAGACPYEVLDISPWAEATYRHFVRNPLGQRLPRKFKVNFSGCSTDCGQAMFNDVGVVATSRRRDDGTIEAGFRVYLAGGLGASPHPAVALEDFTSREDLLPTIEAILRVFDQTGNRDNRLRARMKWLVDTLGLEELRRKVFATRRLLPASSSWPGGLPDEVALGGDEPAGRLADGEVTAMGHGTPVVLSARGEYDRWLAANVVRGVANGAVSAYAWAELGDITAAQFRALAEIQRELGASVRMTNRQNLVFRDLRDDQLPGLFERLKVIGMDRPGAELLRDVVSCPGADTCSLAVTQSRGLAKAIGDRLEEEGLAEVGGIRINISGCMNSCGQHHIADIGFFGLERRVHGQSAPGYQMLLGGHLADETVHFGDKAMRIAAKRAPEAVVRVVQRFAAEREAGERFTGWLARAGGAKAVAATLADLDDLAPPDRDPDLYVDFGETGPYEVTLGASECL